MSQNSNPTVETQFVSIASTDTAIIDIQKRIDKISLIQIWVLKALALLERYLKTLDVLEVESDSAKRGVLIEEIDICYMSSISYFLRSFLHQKRSYCLEIKLVTADPILRETFRKLMDLRNDEFVHWKGARSTASVKYSFTVVSATQFDFAKDVQINFADKVGPDELAVDVRKLFEATLHHIELLRGKEIDKLRLRLAKPEVWQTTNFLNEAGEPIIKKS